ncbi:MAG TPA: AEC family transporter [Gammaproteobacteria bacterium]|nr:AEC family transporter [Gammaproteobacteria bacterium]
MHDVLIQIFALIGLGVIYSFFRPGGIDNVVVRNVLTSSVYYVFLPALVLNVLWHATLDLTSVKISASANIGIISSLVLASVFCRFCNSRRDITGAMMLAAAFPNATYIGLPLLESTFGSWARSIAIQFDMFAASPLVLTAGIIIAERFGKTTQHARPFRALLKAAPLWAVVIAIGLNLSDVSAPAWLDGLLEKLGSVVVPLMLFAVGLALPRGLSEWRSLPAVIPVVLIQLFIMPLIVWFTATQLGMEGETLRALVVESALPSMALGIVICDRFGLNTGIYAAALMMTTLISFFTLPLWYWWV